MTIRADEGQETISRNIYGHFAEHLRHCIYGGFCVGQGSDIPNTRGIRNDVAEALKAIKIPVLRWPGGRRPRMDGVAPHYYCGTGRQSRSATEFTEIDWF